MYGDKWASGTSHSIIVVNVVVILLSFCRRRSVKIFGRGAVLHVSALSPRWRQRWCARRRPLPMFFAVQLAASDAVDGCSRRPTIPRPRQLAERTRHGDTADETTALQLSWHNPPRPTIGWCGLCRVPGVPKPQYCIFVRIPFRRSFFACARPRPVWPVSARSSRNGAANCVLIQVFDCVKCGQQ